MDELKAKLMLLLAGLGGAFVGVYTSSEPLTRKQQIGFIVAGMLTAVFVIPWVVEYFNLPGPNASSLLAFVTGCWWKKVINVAGDAVDKVKLPWSNRNE